MRRQEIAQLLPSIVQRTLPRPGEEWFASPLEAFLASMEGLHEGAEAVLDQIDTLCDPVRAPDALVPFLAGWVDLERVFAPEPERAVRADSAATAQTISTGHGRLRLLIAAAADLAKWRGTEKGLSEFLRTATGLDGFRIEVNPPDASGLPQPFFVRVVAPAEARPHRALVERIIEVERPAYCRWELAFAD
jgi:phage tail-like protein